MRSAYEREGYREGMQGRFVSSRHLWHTPLGATNFPVGATNPTLGATNSHELIQLASTLPGIRRAIRRAGPSIVRHAPVSVRQSTGRQ
jgi:hypothetical protein